MNTKQSRTKGNNKIWHPSSEGCFYAITNYRGYGQAKVKIHLSLIDYHAKIKQMSQSLPNSINETLRSLIWLGHALHT